jgi:hypothetical protein
MQTLNVRIGRYREMFLISNFALKYAIKTVKGNQVRLEVNGQQQFLTHALGVILLSGNMNTTKRILVTIGC